MRGARRGLGALALALSMLFSIALGTAVARAVGEGNTLIVQVADGDDEGYAADLATADVVVDVYKFASTVGLQGEYALEPAYASLQAQFDAAQEGEGNWQTLASEAAALAEGTTPVATDKPIGSSISLADDGIYLVLAHGASEPAGSGRAYSATWEYSFQPSLVALPTKAPNEDGQIRTDTPGDWLTEATIYLKLTREPLYGPLAIQKQVEGFDGKKTTFVFRVVDAQTGGQLYDEYASITYPDQTSTVLTHIPAGMEVVVYEVYEGGRYRQVSGDGSGGVIVADRYLTDGVPAITVTFVNEPDGDHPHGGYGFENHYEYDPQTQDWPLTQIPAPQE